MNFGITTRFFSLFSSVPCFLFYSTIIIFFIPEKKTQHNTPLSLRGVNWDAFILMQLVQK